MPTPHELSAPEALEGMPEVPTNEHEEQRFRTIAVRVQEDLHAQLSFIAQLAGSSLSEEIRKAIERRVASAQDDPELIARAQAAREQIEREAAARSAAIAGFMGSTAIATSRPTRTRKATKTASE